MPFTLQARLLEGLIGNLQILCMSGLAGFVLSAKALF